MRKKRTLSERYPLSSFDTRYRAIWLNAALKEMEIAFASPGEAKQFQTRLQLYRAVLVEQKPEEKDLMYRAKTSRSGRILRIGPADTRFNDLLADLASGADVPPAVTSDTSEHANGLPPSALTGEALAELLAPHVNDSDITDDELFRDLHSPK